MERHEVSTDWDHDRSKSVSDASQNDTDESAVRKFFFVSDLPSGSVSSPSLDDESGNHTTVSPESQSMAPLETPNGSMSSKLASPSLRSEAGLVTQPAIPLPLPNGRFGCPKCPRIFPRSVDAR